MTTFVYAFIVPTVIFYNHFICPTTTNIIYVMSDHHDADAISAYNKTYISTPNIDRLAKEGILLLMFLIHLKKIKPVSL